MEKIQEMRGSRRPGMDWRMKGRKITEQKGKIKRRFHRTAIIGIDIVELALSMAVS